MWAVVDRVDMGSIYPPVAKIGSRRNVKRQKWTDRLLNQASGSRWVKMEIVMFTQVSLDLEFYGSSNEGSWSLKPLKGQL